MRLGGLPRHFWKLREKQLPLMTPKFKKYRLRTNKNLLCWKAEEFSPVLAAPDEELEIDTILLFDLESSIAYEVEISHNGEPRDCGRDTTLVVRPHFIPDLGVNFCPRTHGKLTWDFIYLHL